jgi:cyclophilin family peptidyl-prolyl cis-trans isomerase
MPPVPTEKRLRQRENREEARRRRQLGDKRAKRRKNAIRFGGVAVGVIAVGFLLSLGGDDAPTTTTAASLPFDVAATTPATEPPPTATPDTTPATTPTDLPIGEPVATTEYEEFRALPVACGGELPEPAMAMGFPEAEDQGIDPATELRARIQTSCGDIVVLLDPTAAPRTVNSFVFLSRQGYYDGTVSHRIVPGFVYQAGDPTARGTGGPGYQYEDELPTSDFVYTRGTLAMANAGPNTNGSQFFIIFQDSELPPNFTVFGRVESGLDVLDRIEAVPVVNQEPQEGVFIEGITIEG